MVCDCISIKLFKKKNLLKRNKFGDSTSDRPGVAVVEEKRLLLLVGALA